MPNNLILVIYNTSNTLIGEPTGPRVLSNVAIAAAITSYSRLTINPFKTDPNNPCFYSDTDSIFVQNPIDPRLINPILGAFKDELKGGQILKAIFLKPKTYGYITSTGKEMIVLAGYPKNTLTFSDLERALKGGDRVKSEMA